ncbi:MAG TPA: GNAT family N-acetyltransferase [bacterium]|nr:GNAT family N-acetyltransferase [bacterium]
MTVTTCDVRRVTRDEVQRWLPQLDAWLLPDCAYGVQHTWPQLYRNDGNGAFFVLLDGDHLVSHCATRIVTLREHGREQDIALLGSVVTAPAYRGRGLASSVLRCALDELNPNVAVVLLWAERPELYQRQGFAPTGDDTCLVLARTPKRHHPHVRLATIDDHAALHRLHLQKPRCVVRSERTMSTLLTTPGMTTAVLTDGDEQPIAYACCGKGADLQGHWHELGGTDEALAELLPEALHLAELTEAALLLPPYRPRLRTLLGRQVVHEFCVRGPMANSPEPLTSCWIDGLDSV